MISGKQAKFIKSLKLKKYRKQERKFLVEGYKSVKELLKSDFTILQLLCTEQYAEEFINHDPLVVSQRQLEALGSLKSNDSCLAVAEMKDLIQNVRTDSHILVLDGISDPGNLGTIIRTADWFGFDQIIVGEDTAELYNPKVIMSSMGSFTRVNLIVKDLPEYLKKLDCPIYGMDMKGDSLDGFHPHEPSVFVLGGEANGLSESVSELLTGRLSIRRLGGAESLNVAMAAGILMHHLRFSS